MKVGHIIGPYQVLAKLGEGGMGEVYRARDSRLDRDVALKILPEPFALDAERLARFDREAKTLASMNHPHIAHIYGLEALNDVRALVLELVEGETLAERIARGPLPVDEAVPIARQIAEALEAAHEAGIIQRDLKPAPGATSTTSAVSPQVGIPPVLFALPDYNNVWIPEKGGQRFLVGVQVTKAMPAPIQVVLNWSGLAQNQK